MELSRRFFLGGAISLMAAQTFPVKLLGNTPQIYADRVHDDTAGLGALFRKEPVIFSAEKIGVDSHKGVTFHFGRFKISQTIELPPGLKVKVEGIELDIMQLYESFPVLRGRDKELVQFTGLFTHYVEPVGSHRMYLEYADLGMSEDEREAQWAKMMKNQSTYADWDRRISA